MNSFYLFLFVILFINNNGCKSENFTDSILDIYDDPDMNLNVTQLIKSKGYPVEEHTVRTEDGYILGVQRIPFGREEEHNSSTKKKVVLLQHGLFTSASDWVINFPHQSLGFILADSGFDVWLGNIRGNTYSRRHDKYSPDEKEFWKFSFDEMGEFDLPAMIDLALNVSGQTELYLVGHSQGTTASFAMLSSKPEFNKKVKLFIALAPIATVGHVKSSIRYITPFAHDLDSILELFGTGEILPHSRFLKDFSEFFCNTKIKFICENLIFLICGTDYSQLNTTRLGVYVSFTPAGASIRSLVHYAQMIKSSKFLKYDHGREGNLLHYNQTTPPEYFVENITTDTALFWAQNDLLADPDDVHLLEAKLKTLVSSNPAPRENWNHVDFTWGVDANAVIYEPVLHLLKRS